MLDNKLVEYNNDFEFNWLLGEIEVFWKEELNKSNSFPTQAFIEFEGSDGKILLFRMVMISLLYFLIYSLICFVSAMINWSFILAAICVAVGLVLEFIYFAIQWADLDEYGGITISAINVIKRYFHNRLQIKTLAFQKEVWMIGELNKTREKFLTDEKFRIGETKRFLQVQMIPNYRSEIELIKAESSTKTHAKRVELEADEKILNHIIKQRANFLNDEHRNGVIESLEENRRQQQELTDPVDLIIKLNETEQAMRLTENLAINLETLLSQINGYEKDIIIINKYSKSEYQSVNSLAGELYDEQMRKLEQITNNLRKVQASGLDMINEAKQLSSGESPVTKLITT